MIEIFSPLKRSSCLVLALSLFVLGGCNNGLEFPIHKDENTSVEEQRNKLKEETSHLKREKPTHGSNPKNLFGGSLRSDSERLDRLEKAVQSMRNDFDRVRPSIRRLIDLEGELQRLIQELKVMNKEEVGALPPPQKPQTPKKAKVQAPRSPSFTQKEKHHKKPPVVQSGKASVYDIRVGEHPNRTRLVMDVSNKTTFDVDIDNDERIMIIDLPNAGWSADKSDHFPRSNFIASYAVEPSDNGHILILQLKRDARIVHKEDLAGEGYSRRLVIDLQDA